MKEHYNVFSYRRNNTMGEKHNCCCSSQQEKEKKANNCGCEHRKGKKAQNIKENY